MKELERARTRALYPRFARRRHCLCHHGMCDDRATTLPAVCRPGPKRPDGRRQRARRSLRSDPRPLRRQHREGGRRARRSAVDHCAERSVRVGSCQSKHPSAAVPDESPISRRLLFAVVRNVARNMRRRAFRRLPHEELSGRPEITDDVPGVDELLARAENELRLIGCVSKLSDIPHGVVRWRMLQELSGDDVARELGLRRRSRGDIALSSEKEALPVRNGSHRLVNPSVRFSAPPRFPIERSSLSTRQEIGSRRRRMEKAIVSLRLSSTNIFGEGHGAYCG